MLAKARKMKKLKTGTVVSDKMQNSAVVEVELWKTHRIIGKRYRRTVRYLVDNPDNAAKTGDAVTIEETRPLSRHKHWRIVPTVVKVAKKKAPVKEKAS